MGPALGCGVLAIFLLASALRPYGIQQPALTSRVVLDVKQAGRSPLIAVRSLVVVACGLAWLFLVVFLFLLAVAAVDWIGSVALLDPG